MLRTLILLILVLLPTSSSLAYNTFHPEADETLKQGKVWVETSFKDKSDTAVRTVFRAWLPYPAPALWDVLTDSNEFKLQEDYTDSRTLDVQQFQSLLEKKPQTSEDFYKMVGDKTYPSFHGQIKNGIWTSYVFQRFNFPWPLQDRWNVMKVRNDETKTAQGAYVYEYKTYLGNFKELKGNWELLPAPNKPGWTEWRGDYRADPGISVPQFLAKTLFRASMRKSVKVRMDILEKKGVQKTGSK